MRGLKGLRRQNIIAGAAGLILSRSVSGRAATRAASDGGVTDELIEAAQKEGSITYYHVTPIDVTNSWTEAFSQKYGIPTKNVRGPGYPTWDKWLNESRVGRHICDVIQVTDPSVIEPANKGGFV